MTIEIEPNKEDRASSRKAQQSTAIRSNRHQNALPEGGQFDPGQLDAGSVQRLTIERLSPWLDATLVIYWLLFVGTGVSAWLAATGRMPLGWVMSSVHWGLLVCLIASGLIGIREDLRRGVTLSYWQIGLYALLLLTIADGILRSGLTNLAVMSTVMACLIILFFNAGFRDERSVGVMAFAMITIVLSQVVILAFEIYNDRFLSMEYGRAAGLYRNPNVAGSALAIAGLSSLRWVPGNLRLGFLCTVGFGIVLTLSRSSLMAFGAGCAWIVFWQMVRGSDRRELLSGWPVALAVCVIGGAVIAASFNAENRYQYALLDSASEIVRLITGDDLKLAERRAEQVFAGVNAAFSDETGSYGDGQSSTEVRWTENSAAEEAVNIEEITLSTAGELNSALSRVLLLKRSLESFLNNFWLGIGIAESFTLRSHNTLLHAGNSFGVLGVLALGVFLLGYLMPEDSLGDNRATGVALAVIMMFSHGVFANNPLVLAVAVSTVLLRQPKQETNSQVG